VLSLGSPYKSANDCFQIRNSSTLLKSFERVFTPEDTTHVALAVSEANEAAVFLEVAGISYSNVILKYGQEGSN